MPWDQEVFQNINFKNFSITTFHPWKWKFLNPKVMEKWFSWLSFSIVCIFLKFQPSIFRGVWKNKLQLRIAFILFPPLPRMQWDHQKLKRSLARIRQDIEPQARNSDVWQSQWYSSWWLDKPIWKILVKLQIFPQIGVNVRNIWNHHWPPPSCFPFFSTVPLCRFICLKPKGGVSNLLYHILSAFSKTLPFAN